MKCCKCGASTVVTSSVGGEVTGNARGYLVHKAQAVYGWWSDQDFRTRERKCGSCGEQVTTIEVPLTDLRDAFDDLRALPTFASIVAGAKRKP